MWRKTAWDSAGPHLGKICNGIFSRKQNLIYKSIYRNKCIFKIIWHKNAWLLEIWYDVIYCYYFIERLKFIWDEFHNILYAHEALKFSLLLVVISSTIHVISCSTQGNKHIWKVRKGSGSHKGPPCVSNVFGAPLDVIGALSNESQQSFVILA